MNDTWSVEDDADRALFEDAWRGETFEGTTPRDQLDIAQETRRFALAWNQLIREHTAQIIEGALDFLAGH